VKWLKWISGIVLAGVVTLWPANLIMHHTGKVDMNNLTPFQYWIKFLAVPSLAFGLFVFLSCLFVPLFKKYAGMLVFTLSLIFIGLGAWQHYTDDGVLRKQYLVRYTGFVTGLIIGFSLSYKSFKQNKWSSL
jgi:uncharacterized paraquat-inducible protein A